MGRGCRPGGGEPALPRAVRHAHRGCEWHTTVDQPLQWDTTHDRHTHTHTHTTHARTHTCRHANTHVCARAHTNTHNTHPHIHTRTHTTHTHAAHGVRTGACRYRSWLKIQLFGRTRVQKIKRPFKKIRYVPQR